MIREIWKFILFKLGFDGSKNLSEASFDTQVKVKKMMAGFASGKNIESIEINRRKE